MSKKPNKNSKSAKATSSRLAQGIEAVTFVDVVATIDGSDMWREVLIPGHLPLVALASAIVDLFEWSGERRWYFEQPEQKAFYDDPAAERIAPRPGETWHSAGEASIAQLLGAEGATARFVYDFDDNWQVVLEARGSLSEGEYPYPLMPMCVAGFGASPLEGVGGLEGWEQACKALEDPSDPRHAELRAALGLEEAVPFSREYFSTHEANTMFAISLFDGQQGALPADVDALRDMVVSLTAEMAAYRADALLEMGRAISTED